MSRLWSSSGPGRVIAQAVGVAAVICVLIGAGYLALGFGLPRCYDEPACLAITERIVERVAYADCMRGASKLRVGMSEAEARAVGVRFEPGTRSGAPIQIGLKSCTRLTNSTTGSGPVYEGTAYRVYASAGRVYAVTTRPVTRTRDPGSESRGS